MATIAYSPVNIQTSVQSMPSIPAWFGEITLSSLSQNDKRCVARRRNVCEDQGHLDVALPCSGLSREHPGVPSERYS